MSDDRPDVLDHLDEQEREALIEEQERQYQLYGDLYCSEDQI